LTIATKRHYKATWKKTSAKGSNVFTDELVAYWGLDEKYVHEIVNHAEQYVNGHINTNGMETSGAY
jgi:hypothetical protein